MNKLHQLVTRYGIAVLFASAIIPRAWADDSAVPTSAPAITSSNLESPSTPTEANPEPISDAEKIARLQRCVNEGEQLLNELRQRVNDPEGEYAQAEREFSELDAQAEAVRKQAQSGPASAPAQDGLPESELTALENKRQLAKDRFDLAIRERKVLQEQIATLETKLQQDIAALRKLRGEPDPAASRPAGTVAGPETEPTTTQPAAVEPVATASATAQPPKSGAVEMLTKAASGGVTTGGAAKDDASKPPLVSKLPPTPELEKARLQAAREQVQAQEAAKEAQSATERMEASRKAIALEQQLLQTARERADNARKTEQTLYEELQDKWQSGAPREEMGELRDQIGEARARSWKAEQEIRERSNRIATLQEQLANLQSEHIAALQQAKQLQDKAESTQKRVQQLENPLSPRNILRWLLERGPRVVGIAIGMAILLWACRLLENRIIGFLSSRSSHGSYEDQENRVRTLVGVFRSAAVVAITTGGTLMLLSELSVNIVPLMGGAAVIGLAVAFGAQNLIRDYFYGFMILLENQYAINDVVKLGDISGQVENITLRITVLRGLDGTVHFVPNGQITQVSNMTHDWSRALFEVRVAYKSDVDQVMQILVELGKELRRDPNFRGMILEMPEMLGVDEFTDSAMVIKFFIKTRPLKQWAVKREMLRRIKLKFDELGIEIPFPQRTVHHRVEANSGFDPNTMSWAANAEEKRNL